MTTALLMRIAFVTTVGILGSAGIASVAPRDLSGHRSSLRATAMMTDGTVRGITLEGVGCNVSMCSRVAIENVKLHRMWLDGLTSIREISHGSAGPVTVTLGFKNGVDTRESIAAANRVLYIEGRSGHTEKLDIARLSRLDFSENSK